MHADSQAEGAQAATTTPNKPNNVVKSEQAKGSERYGRTSDKKEKHF
jgi:hypothetical protein